MPKKKESDICDLDDINNLYIKKCGSNNQKQIDIELENRNELLEHPTQDSYLYPTLDDPYFNIKIAEKKEFNDTRYDGSIYDVEAYANVLKTAEYELLPQQAFVRNFLSFQTPFNSLLLFHGLGSGKTCASIGVCEEMRDYLKQMGINKRIIIVASPNVQDNFKLQLFDERKLKEVDGIWTVKGCLGNKLLKEINPTGMKGLKKEKVIQQVKALINASYSFQGYVQFSNEIVKISGSQNDSSEARVRNLNVAYSDSLIVIDEVHNIRISDDNENKNVAKNLMYLVSVVSNVRLLLLSATPMFNSYKEIVWLLNLVNMNDRRGIVAVSDIFDKNGDWKKDKNGNEIGKEMLIRKATGYVSYVRGENPYTFPFRVYPDRFSPTHTFRNISEYPLYQINGRKIPDNKKISKLCLFLTNIGEYQQMGYSYIIDQLRRREKRTIQTKTGVQRNVSAFMSLKSIGYTDLQLPIESLNIVYPYSGLEELYEEIPEMEYVEEEEEEMIEDISLLPGKKEKEIVEEIDEVISTGPKHASPNYAIKASEMESEPAITEGIEADDKMFEIAVEPDTRKIHKMDTAPEPAISNSIFDEVDNQSKKEKKEKKGRKGKKEKEKEEKEEEKKAFKETLVPKKRGRPKKTDIKNGGGGDTELLHIDPKDLTGSQGLQRIMSFKDSKTPSVKGEFEYRDGVPRVFDKDEIGKYSSKIKNICDSIYNRETDVVSDGIILIYSSYIDAGVIPMALALEEMGFTRYGEKAKPLFKTPPVPVVDVRTMKPPTNKKDFKPARYIMITGDPRISPNNDADVKAITNDNNIYREEKDGTIVDVCGEMIKVVIISQAGSEGLDFKGIRQLHLLEPWYNINRTEQIIGRGVRNFSHKDLPFEKRNVEIFLYGTLLKDAHEESADLYIYRISELKAVKIGKVSRLLKQTSVDCIINHDQTELTAKNFNKIEENKNITQILSDHQKLTHFEVGDMDNSATCDFMECEFKCLPDTQLDDTKLNTDTYNEAFMLVNADKIIQKIKSLMKMRYFYKKQNLIQLINTPKKYPTSQIYAALTQIITDNTEYISDRYGRTGYLVNIGDYYLFQPSELNYKNISMYDRSVPIDYKHHMVKFTVKTDEVLNNAAENKKSSENGKKILDDMFANYKQVGETTKVVRGSDDWYQHCGIVMRKMIKETHLFPNMTVSERLSIFERFLIEHIVDSLMMQDRLELLNYMYSVDTVADNGSSPEQLKFQGFFDKTKSYLKTKEFVSNGLTGMIMFDGPSRIENIHMFILRDDIWVPAQSEDKRDLEQGIMKKYHLKKNLNRYVGFVGFETNVKFMAYKVKDTENERSTGFRCTGKKKIVSILVDLYENKYPEADFEKDGAVELCVRQELTLRALEHLKRDNMTYFLDTEMAIMNEFEKREKPGKK